MKAITVLQPYASLIACGAKKIETRSWATKYRGPIAIHAGKSWEMWRRELTYRDPFHSALWPKMTEEEIRLNGYERSKLLPVGAVIAIANLVGCASMPPEIPSIMFYPGKFMVVIDEREMAFGDFTPGRYAWILENVQKIDPVPVKGMQRLWNWDGDK